MLNTCTISVPNTIFVCFGPHLSVIRFTPDHIHPGITSGSARVIILGISSFLGAVEKRVFVLALHGIAQRTNAMAGHHPQFGHVQGQHLTFYFKKVYGTGTVAQQIGLCHAVIL